MANSRPGNQETDCQLYSKSNPKLREAVGIISTELTDERSRLLKNGDGNTLLLQNVCPNDTKSMKVTIKQRFKNACKECEKTKVQLEEVELERSFFERILNEFLTTLDSAVESMGPLTIKLPHVPKLANKNRRLEIKEDRKSIRNKLKRITDLLNEDAQTIKILQRENEEMKRKVEETEKSSKEREEEHIKWVEAMEKMRTDISKYKKELTKNLQMEEEYKKRLKEEERKTKDAEQAKLQALTRLSKEMGTKLNDNNLATADLSDPNRATKLAEMYSEIYDNEWTDALEELDNYGYTEEESIRMLWGIVKKADEFCKKKAEDQLKNIEDIFFMSNAGEDKGSFQNKKNIMKMLKDHRKSTADKNAERIYKEFSTRHDQKNRISAEYVKKIVKLCWLMAVQDPPVCFGNEANADDRINTDIFKPYTQTGITVSYTVWLPMFLHEGGPLLSKGVAQPVSFRAKSAPTSGYRNDKTEVKSRPTPERYTTAENRIPQTKYALESTVETKFHYNEPKHKYHQANDYKLDRHAMHIPRNEFATSVYNYDTRSYLGTNYNTTYTSPKYEQKTVLPHRLGNYAMDPYRRY